MLVTAIEKGKGARWNVFVEGEFALSLDAQTLATSSIKAGQEIGREVLFALKGETDRRRAKERALYLLDMRSHTKKELFDKLRKTTDADIAEETAQRMEELGLVDDAAYARRLAHSLAEQKGWGAMRIRQRLAEKGIERELAAEVIADLEETVDAQEQLVRLIHKKYMRHLSDKKGVDKTIAALVRMGYRFADIKRALAECAENAPEPECEPDF